MAKISKKLLGIIYPIGILCFVLFIYFSAIVCLYYLNTEYMFATTFLKIHSIIYLVIFHVLLALILYCYLNVMFMNPGEPPQFWVS